MEAEKGPITDSLADRTTRAAQWRLTGAVVGVLFQLTVGVLLARRLAPADFGTMALAVMVLGLAQIVGDLGIGDAIVQRAAMTTRHVGSAFSFSVVMGLTMSGLMVMAAPLGAVAMGDAQVTPILRVLSARFVLRGVAVVAEALLRRQLNFRRLFFIDAIGYVLGYGGVAVTLALLGHGVWSLVWGSLVQALVTSAAQLASVRSSIRPLFGRRDLGELLHFGIGSTVSGCVNYVALNGDNFVVGRSFGPASLGLYGRAYTLVGLPHEYLSKLISAVMFPAFSQLQGEPAQLRRGYLFLTKVTSMIAAPVMVTLAIAAPYLIRSLYGPQWSGVVVPLQILCFAGYFRALYHLGGVVAQSLGRVYSELRRQVVYGGLVVGGGLMGSRFGLPGVAVGVNVATLYMFIAMAQLALQVTETPWHRYFRTQFAAVIVAGVTGGVAVSIRLLLEARHAPDPVIAFSILAGAAIPSSVAWLWQLGEADFDVVRTRLPRWCARLVVVLRAPSVAG